MSNLAKKSSAALGRLAAKGRSDALAELGLRHAFGLADVAVDKPKAAEYLAAAAIMGRTDAKWNLGQMYLNGDGVTQNYGRALELFESGAAQGDADAKVSLASMHAKGLGTEENLIKAAELLLEAGKSKDIFAKGAAIYELEDIAKRFDYPIHFETSLTSEVVDAHKAMAARVARFLEAHKDFGKYPAVSSNAGAAPTTQPTVP